MRDGRRRRRNNKAERERAVWGERIENGRAIVDSSTHDEGEHRLTLREDGYPRAKEREDDKVKEPYLARRHSRLVAVHEERDGQPLTFLVVALREELLSETLDPLHVHVFRCHQMPDIRHLEDHTEGTMSCTT